MATAKKSSSSTTRGAGAKTASKTAAKGNGGAAKSGASRAAGKSAGAGEIKPIKDAMSKTALVAHLAEASGQDPRAVKAVMLALEHAVLGSVHKKGAGGFTMPGLFKVTVTQVAAKKARKGINPFTKQEQMFAAKPASVRVKVRPLARVKTAAA